MDPRKRIYPTHAEEQEMKRLKELYGEQVSLVQGLRDRKAGRMYPWSEVKAERGIL